jgi:hypothetical protein
MYESNNKEIIALQYLISVRKINILSKVRGSRILFWDFHRTTSPRALALIAETRQFPKVPAE